MTAWVFPGQGSQYVGMAAAWLARSRAARDAVGEASTVLGLDVGQLIASGPEEDLADTYNQQPAVLTASMAILRAAAETLPEPDFLAGHSLGEYGALVAGGSIAYPDALGLVRERGRLMRLAGEREPGGMAAILGLDDADVEGVCRRTAGVQVANYNSPGQVVISGTDDGVRTACAELEGMGARRVVRLPITIAAHSQLMASVAGDFARAIGTAAIGDPRVPIVANVTAEPVRDAAAIREELARQLTSSVRWTDSVARLLDAGVRTFYEIGPGNVLTGLVRRIAKHAGVDVRAVSLDQPEGLEAAKEAT